MKNLIYVFIVFSIVVFMPSCSHQDINDENTVETVKELQSKAQYLALSQEDRKQAWISKLQTYQNLNLSNVQKSLISDMVADLKNMVTDEFYLSEQLRGHAIAMARITPGDDYLNLFTDVTNVINLSNTGGICELCITDLENYVRPESSKNSEENSEKKMNCNCRWACAWFEMTVGCTRNDDCKATKDGCGFMGTSGCNGGCY